MDGASLCIYAVSSINNPRCAWHGGVPESPFVIMDGWRLHKPLPPAESALRQAPHASRGPGFPGGRPTGGPSPRVSAPSLRPPAPRRLSGCWKGFVTSAAARRSGNSWGSFLLALAWEVWLFIGGFAGFFFTPSHLLKEKSTGQMLSLC